MPEKKDYSFPYAVAVSVLENCCFPSVIYLQYCQSLQSLCFLVHLTIFFLPPPSLQVVHIMLEVQSTRLHRSLPTGKAKTE